MRVSMDSRWYPIARSAWEVLHDTTLAHAVRPSIPILYFGDLEAYQRSPLRVITVGLNPSRLEFPTDAPFRRFPGGGQLEPGDTASLLTVLNEYYRADPYRSWFGSYEPVLNGLGASYYGTHASTALHTDLFSPIATDPTWSRLSRSERAPLKDFGIRLWHEIADILQPHLVVLSIARAHLSHIDYSYAGDWEVVAELTHGQSGPRRKPYALCCRRTRPNDQPTLAFGSAAQKPFGTVSRDDRVRLGEHIREFVERSP